MRQALANTPNTDFPTPQEGIVQRIVHRQTGLLADLSNNNELKKENEADNFQPGSMLSGLLNQVFEKLGQNQPDSDSAHTKETDAQKRTKLEGPYLTGSKPLPEDSFIEYFLKGTEPTDLNSSLPPPPIEILEGMGFAP